VIPLKNMFALAGYDNASDAIELAKETDKGLTNLLYRVARAATKYIHSVWKDYKDIEIELRPHGDKIAAGVKEKYNVFNFDQRSDGFKRGGFKSLVQHLSILKGEVLYVKVSTIEFG
ncbi:MAG: hypothetical protein ACRDHW_19405, partial [Ktedonobacteraceae bacterium]